MGPTWGPSGADRSQMGPMLALWTLLSGNTVISQPWAWITFITWRPDQNDSLKQTTWQHGDVIKWKHFPRYRPFVRGIHRSPVNIPHKGQWRRALMFSLNYARISGWVNNRGDLRRHRAHYDVTFIICTSWIKRAVFWFGWYRSL